MDCFKPFVWYLPQDYVLSGQLDERSSTYEWEWMRIHAALDIKTKDCRFLNKNMEFIQNQLAEAAATWKQPLVMHFQFQRDRC